VEAVEVEVLRLVEAPPALEAPPVLEAGAVEVLAERSQQAEGVVGVVGVLLPLPRLLAMRIGARRGAGLFFDLVVEAAWRLCSVKRGPEVALSLPQQLSCHSMYVTRTCSHPGSFAQSLS
jgi:hypothetical protein